MAMLDWKTPF